MSQVNFNGASILVTRPLHQAENLCRMIERQGGIAQRFPTLEIKPVADMEAVKRKLAALANYDWLIFISANAVNFAVNANDGKIDQLFVSKIAAVGRATAKALRDKGLTVDLLPEQGFNSEALLQTPEMRYIDGRRFLIVRGQGGRELLADILRARGATVDYLEVYRRMKPEPDDSELLSLLRQHRLAAITITSGETLQNLLSLLREHAALLCEVPVVVISDRIGQMAEQMGFQQIAVTEDPSDAAIIQTLTTLQRGKQWPK